MSGPSSPANPHPPDEPDDEIVWEEDVELVEDVSSSSPTSLPPDLFSTEKLRRTDPSRTPGGGISQAPPTGLRARQPAIPPPAGESFSELAQVTLIVLVIAFLIAVTGVGTYVLMAKGKGPIPDSLPNHDPAASDQHGNSEEIQRLQRELQRKSEELAQFQRNNGQQSDQAQMQTDQVQALTSKIQALEREQSTQASSMNQARTAQRNAEEALRRTEQRLEDAERRARESAELAAKAKQELLAEKAIVRAGVLPPVKAASAFAPSIATTSQPRVPLLDAAGAPLNPDRNSPDRVKSSLPLAVAARGEGEASTAIQGNGPSEAAKQSLLVEVERAIQLIESDQIEPLIDEFFPTESVRTLRKEGSLTEAAKSLKDRGDAIPNLLSRLEQCRTGLTEGNDWDIQFVPNLAGAEAPNPAAMVEGYGDDFRQVLERGGADLKAGKYEEFLTSVLPLAEVLELKRTDQLEAVAEQFRTYPALVASMSADFEAMSQTQAQPEDGAIRLGLSGSSDDEGTREVRWQLVGGSWRFFDQTTEAKDRIKQVEKDAGLVRAILKFERVRDHWRLTELPK